MAVGAAVAAFAVVVALSYSFPLHYPGAVSLGTALNSSVVGQNQTVRVSLSDTNLLPLANQAAESELRSLNLSAGPCGGTFPIGVALYQGMYTFQNVSSSDSIAVYSPGVYNCPNESGAAYELGPLQTVGFHVDLSGYWTEATTTDQGGVLHPGVLHPFGPGEYTLVVGDGWGNVRLLHFQVKSATA